MNVTLPIMTAVQAKELTQDICETFTKYGKLLEDVDTKRINTRGEASFYIYDISSFGDLQALIYQAEIRKADYHVSIASRNSANSIASYQISIFWTLS